VDVKVGYVFLHPNQAIFVVNTVEYLDVTEAVFSNPHVDLAVFGYPFHVMDERFI